MRRPLTMFTTCTLALALGGCSLLDLPKDLKQATCSDDAFCASLNESHPGTSCQRWYCVAGTGGSHCTLSVRDDDRDDAPHPGCETVGAPADCDDSRGDVSPLVDETRCDRVDDDCDGEVDEGVDLAVQRIATPAVPSGGASLSFAQTPGASTAAVVFRADRDATDDGVGPPTGYIALGPTSPLESSAPLAILFRREQSDGASVSLSVMETVDTNSIAVAPLDADRYAVAFTISSATCERLVAGVMTRAGAMQLEILENVYRFGLRDEGGSTCPPSSTLCRAVPACDAVSEVCGSAVRCVPACVGACETGTVCSSTGAGATCIPFSPDITGADCSPACTGGTVCGLADACWPACSPACAADEVCSGSRCIASQRAFASPAMATLPGDSGRSDVLLAYARADTRATACPAPAAPVEVRLLFRPRPEAHYLLDDAATPVTIGTTTDSAPPAVVAVPGLGWLVATADTSGIVVRHVALEPDHLAVTDLGRISGTDLGDVTLALGPTAGASRQLAIAYRRGCLTAARIYARFVTLEGATTPDLGASAEVTIDGSPGGETLPALAYSGALHQWLVTYRKSSGVASRRFTEAGEPSSAQATWLLEPAVGVNIEDRPFAYAIGTTPAFGVLFAVAGTAAPGIYGARVGCAM